MTKSKKLAKLLKMQNSKKSKAPAEEGKSNCECTELADVGKIRGLKNLGNSCFFNSVLQNLIATPSLRKHFQTATKDYLDKRPFEKAIRKTVCEIDNCRKEVYSPKMLFNSIRKTNACFRGNRQQDAHELLCAVFDALSDENAERKAEENYSETQKIIAGWGEEEIENWVNYMEIPYKASELKVSSQSLQKMVAKSESKSFGSVYDSSLLNTEEKEQVAYECQLLKSSSSHFLKNFIFSNGLQPQMRAWRQFLPEKVFGGVLQSRIVCKDCSHAENIFEDFSVLSLSISFERRKKILWENDEEDLAAKMQKAKIGPDLGAKENVSLSECLAHFFRKEHLSVPRGFLCSRCEAQEEIRSKRHGVSRPQNKKPPLLGAKNRLSGSNSQHPGKTTSKQYSLKQMPRVLVVQIKRFQASGRKMSKLNSRVDFPAHLDMSLFAENSSEKSAQYRLFGVVEHIGSLKSGHYVAYSERGRPARREGPEWYYASDSRCKRVDLQKALRSQAYLLFYQSCSA